MTPVTESKPRTQPISNEPRVPLRLSIIIVSWNVRDLLRECIQSVLSNTELASDSYEIIVVDNNSRDGSAGMVAAEFESVRLIASSDNPGFGKANNRAFEIARGETILLLNPDTFVPGPSLDAMVTALERDPTIGILGCRLLNTDGTLQRWTAGSTPTVWRLAVHAFLLDAVLPRMLCGRPLYLRDDVPYSVDVDWLSGACVAIRRTAIEKQLFDDRYFMYGEDLELCHRLKRDGWRVVYFPEVSIVHHHGKSTAQSEEAQMAGLKGPRAFYSMHSGSAGVPAWDLLMTVSFGMRALGWSGLALLGRSSAKPRATSCWKFTRSSFRVMLGG